MGDARGRDVRTPRLTAFRPPAAWRAVLGRTAAAVAVLACLTVSSFADPADSPAPTEDWKAEIGTADTEAALNLTPADRAEIQERLKALDLYDGTETGTLDEATRAAIAGWRTSRGAAPSDYLGPLQLAELRVESEDAYLKLLAKEAAPDVAPASPAAVPAQPVRPIPRRPVRPAPPVQAARPEREPEPRRARTPVREAQEPAAPVRHAARRPAPEAPKAAAQPSCNANPQWCRAAGLPIAAAAPRLGRPPGF